MSFYISEVIIKRANETLSWQLLFSDTRSDRHIHTYTISNVWLSVQ